MVPNVADAVLEAGMRSQKYTVQPSLMLWLVFCSIMVNTQGLMGI